MALFLIFHLLGISPFLRRKRLEALGRHILVEYYQCDRETLNDLSKIEYYMKEAASSSGATVIESIFHLFNPHGISGIVIIAESHLAIHTWPEYSYASVDLFTCGKEVDPWKAYAFLKEKLKAHHTTTIELKRGQVDEM